MNKNLNPARPVALSVLLACFAHLSTTGFAADATGKITYLTEKVELYPFEAWVYLQPNLPLKFSVQPSLQSGLLTFDLPAAEALQNHLQPMFLSGNMSSCTKNLNEGAETVTGLVIDKLNFTRPDNKPGILDLVDPNSNRSGSWMYVQNNQMITGRVDCPGVSFTFDLDLHAGWNTIVTTTQIQNATLMVTQVTADTRAFSWQIKQ